MIDRYADPNLSGIFSREEQLRHWTSIEIAHLAVVSGLRLGVSPNSVLEELGELYIDPKVVDAHEQYTGHEVVAYLEILERMLPPKYRRFLHWGLTSSDLVESARSIQLYAATAHLGQYAIDTGEILTDLPDVAVPGRTHGQVASTTSYTHRFRVASADLVDLLVGPAASRGIPIKLSGAVGRWAVLNEVLADEIADRLEGTHLVQYATQILPAPYHRTYLEAWSHAVDALEQIAIDIRMGCALGELSFKNPARAGSSAMPGKVNPIKAERACGFAKLFRGQASAIAEGRAQWLDRDLSNSALNRLAYEDCAQLVAAMFRNVNACLRDLEFHELSNVNNPHEFADRLLGFATLIYDAPRSAVYNQVNGFIRDNPQATSLDIVDRIAMLPLARDEAMWDGELESLRELWKKLNTEGKTWNTPA